MSERTIRQAVRIGVDAGDRIDAHGVLANFGWLTALPPNVAVRNVIAQGGDKLVMRELGAIGADKHAWALREAGLPPCP